MKHLEENQKNQILEELKCLSRLGYSVTDSIIDDIKKNDSSSKHLIVTDASTSQYGIEITQDIWIYSELDSFTTFLKKSTAYKIETMELLDYSDEELDSLVSPYSENLQNHKKVYGASWKQVALEFIFEQSI